MVISLFSGKHTEQIRADKKKMVTSGDYFKFTKFSFQFSNKISTFCLQTFVNIL